MLPWRETAIAVTRLLARSPTASEADINLVALFVDIFRSLHSHHHHYQTTTTRPPPTHSHFLSCCRSPAVPFWRITRISVKIRVDVLGFPITVMSLLCGFSCFLQAIFYLHERRSIYFLTASKTYLLLRDISSNFLYPIPYVTKKQPTLK